MLLSADNRSMLACHAPIIARARGSGICTLADEARHAAIGAAIKATTARNAAI